MKAVAQSMWAISSGSSGELVPNKVLTCHGKEERSYRVNCAYTYIYVCRTVFLPSFTGRGHSGRESGTQKQL